MADDAVPETPVEIREEAERAAFIAKELEKRRSNDALYLFKPHPKQRAFIDAVLSGEKLHNWFLAANRSGKSDAGAYCGAKLARHGVEPRGAGALSEGGSVVVRDRATSGWVSALDFPTSRDTIQPKYFNNGFVPPGATHAPFIPDHEIEKWNAEAQVLKLRNGSIIGFKSADSGRLKYQAAEKDWIQFDEAHPLEIYQESLIRIGGRPLRFFCTATILPEKGGEHVAWVFDQIITRWQEGLLPDVGVFGASIYDNPHLPEKEVLKLEALYKVGSAQARIRLDGELLSGLIGSRVYTSFERQIHCRPPPVLQSRRPLCWMVDFNVQPMCSAVGQRIDGVFYVIKEFFLEEGSIPDMCREFYDHFGSHRGAVWLFGDATGNERDAQSKISDYKVILNEMRQHRIPIVMKVPLANPPVVDRINAVNVALQNEQGLVSLYIDPDTCPELIKDLDQVVYDKRNKLKKVTNRNDPYFWRTHMSDAMGYWIAYEAPVRVSLDNGSDVKSIVKSLRNPTYMRDPNANGPQRNNVVPLHHPRFHIPLNRPADIKDRR